ncbi:MAG TPA: hypothetical protein VF172_13155 [Nitrososphaera sp.]
MKASGKWLQQTSIACRSCGQEAFPSQSPLPQQPCRRQALVRRPRSANIITGWPAPMWNSRVEDKSMQDTAMTDSDEAIMSEKDHTMTKEDGSIC